MSSDYASAGITTLGEPPCTILNTYGDNLTLDLKMRHTTTQTCYRSHPLGRSPIYAPPDSNYRFNAPEADRLAGTAFGVLYVAKSSRGAYIETVPTTGGLLSESWCKTRAMARLSVDPLRVVDLTGPGLAHLGIDATLTSAFHPITGYAASQDLAKTIHDSTDADAIMYRARHDPSEVSLAIFDRSVSKVHHLESWTWTDRPADLVAWLRRYGHDLAP